MAAPPMVGHNRSVSFDDPNTRECTGVTVQISEAHPNGTDYPYYRTDEDKSAWDWLQEIVEHLPARDAAKIYDVGLGMGRRIPIKPDDPMRSLGIFNREPGSVKIEVSTQGGINVNFAPTRKRKFDDAIRQLRVDEDWAEVPDMNKLAFARDQTLAACPNDDIPAQVAYFKQVNSRQQHPCPWFDARPRPLTECPRLPCLVPCTDVLREAAPFPYRPEV